MTNFVFVHGAWQGGWCWREVVPRLESKGHSVLAIDLPGHGTSSVRPEEVTLQDYVDAVIRAVKTWSVPPILVGHSMCGILSRVGETAPHGVRALVYVAGLVVPNGSSMMDSVKEFDAEYQDQFLWAPDRRSAGIRPEGARRYLYPLCPPDIVKEVLPLLTAEPVGPYETPIRTTSENFGRVPRYYIECLRDRVVPIALQRAMYSAISCKRIYSIDTDHSPFFSAPAELVSILHSISEDV
jgi:pimeloyl-ACP methyl ester carboxylesterase